MVMCKLCVQLAIATSKLQEFSILCGIIHCIYSILLCSYIAIATLAVVQELLGTFNTLISTVGHIVYHIANSSDIIIKGLERV